MMICAVACAGGALCDKITTDPNAGPAQPAQEMQADETDQRLAQKITYEWTRKTVLSIMDDLTQKTGIVFKAGQNGKDWQVRDRRMNIYCKDTPLTSLMNSMARVMKFKWSREKLKDGKYAYRIYMDRKSLLDEEAKRARDEERLARLQAEKRQRALDSITGLANISDADLAKLKKDNPFLYLIGSNGLAKPLAGFLGECPAVAHALATGQAIDLPVSSFSPQAKGYMMGALAGIWKVKSLAEGNSEPFPSDADAMMDSSTMRINGNLQRIQDMGVGESSFLLGEIRVGPEGKPGIEIPLLDPDSNMAKLIGGMLVGAQDSGKSLKDENQRDMQDQLMQAFSKDMATEAADEPAVERPDDPELQKKIKFKPKSEMLPDVESALASGSGFAVVSDSFARSFGMPFRLSDKEIELQELLDKIGESFRYDWDKKSSVIELRDKKWYKKRAAQIPDAWLEAWRKTLKETGTLGLGDLVQICALTWEQFNENIVGSENASLREAVSTIFFMNRELLTFYGALNEAQQAAVFTDGGLDSRSLAPEQLAQLEKLVKARSAKFAETLGSGLTIKGSRNQKKTGRWEYSFTLSGPEGVDPLEWSFNEPKYVEPPKPNDEKQDKPGEKKPEAKQ
jgi:hypothetical protein